MRVLFLARQMSRGYGIPVVVDEQARRLEGGGSGGAPTVGCLEADGSYAHLDVREIPPTPGAVTSLAREVGAGAVVAHASPFHEVLPDLPEGLVTVAWDHGDPPPALFPPGDRERRARTARRKRERVHPAVDRVVVPSHFLRADLGLPDAEVVPNGCDHVPDPGPKPRSAADRESRPFRVGTLARLGPGEARYKGSALFREAVRRLRAAADAGEVPGGVEAALLGRGTDADAAPFREEGIEVILDATDEERNGWLRGLDLFVAPSLWEGFGLPAVEAQAAGTATVVLDAGAHPEVCPLVAGGVDDVVALARACAADPGLLHRHAELGYRFARETFSWDRAAGRLSEIVEEARPRGPVGRTMAAVRRAVGPAALRGAGYRAGRRAWHLAWGILPDRLRPVRRRLAERLVTLAHWTRTEGPAEAARRTVRWLLGRDG